ncbi:hypothetical protein Pfo_023677 [Paulownia fortunei]|nr:hypothetical protein Pfo_023677 [Paulownia fortunei]
MLSFTKTFTTFPSQIACAFQHRYVHSLLVIRSSSDNGNNITSGNDLNASSPVQPPTTPPATVEIRFKRGSRRRRKQQQDGVTDKMPSKQASVPKDWDSMTLTEKATELYMGEKGLLFWLNKFAYASIFIVIGGWILFRFVGPALNIYQLDTPPLAPTSMFKGS